jgi:hypothetical protein
MLHEPRQVQHENAATDVLKSQVIHASRNHHGPILRMTRPHSDTGCSNMYLGANAAGVSEHAQITLDFRRRTGRRLFRIVREFDGGPLL